MVQDRERDFNKDWYFKLNAGSGAEGRNVDVKDWKKLDLPHDWSIFFDFATTHLLKTKEANSTVEMHGIVKPSV